MPVDPPLRPETSSIGSTFSPAHKASLPPLTPVASSPAPGLTPAKSVEQSRRNAASQARRKLKRAAKSMNCMRPLDYRVKPSAIPQLERMAAVAAKVDAARMAVALSGAYVGKKEAKSGKKFIPTLHCLRRLGFVCHPWDGVCVPS